MKRLMRYLDRQVRSGSVLDLGCGNGWLAGRLSRMYNVVGLDVNMPELEQAARLFRSASCLFAYGDVFSAELPLGSFRLIVLSSSVQYFPSLLELVGRLRELLEQDGEIHILDSPLYPSRQVGAARKRTQDYYRGAGLEAMLPFYFHHTYEDLEEFSYDFLYRPGTVIRKLTRKFFQPDSPFPWIRIRK